MNGVLTVSASRTRVSDLLTLTKPRVNLLVVASTLAGYYMAAGEGATVVALVSAVIGTALVSGGAAALNQIAERDTDALMRRTHLRPMPSRRLQPAEATAFALALVAGALLPLALGAELVAAGGDIFTYTIFVDNLGPSVARTVVVSDTFLSSGNVSIQSCAFSPWSACRRSSASRPASAPCWRSGSARADCPNCP